jgi:hypothetical protein
MQMREKNLRLLVEPCFRPYHLPLHPFTAIKQQLLVSPLDKHGWQASLQGWNGA